jgi:uncharacterized protein YegP (UPF0339 family)
MYFEIYKSKVNNLYWFVLKSSGNHQTLATSEMYVRKESAAHTIGVIANNATSAPYYDRTGE